MVKKLRQYKVFFQLDHENYLPRKMIASNKMDIVQHFVRISKACHVKIEKIEVV